MTKMTFPLTVQNGQKFVNILSKTNQEVHMANDPRLDIKPVTCLSQTVKKCVPESVFGRSPERIIKT